MITVVDIFWSPIFDAKKKNVNRFKSRSVLADTAANLLLGEQHSLVYVSSAFRPTVMYFAIDNNCHGRWSLQQSIKSWQGQIKNQASYYDQIRDFAGDIPTMTIVKTIDGVPCSITDHDTKNTDTFDSLFLRPIKTLF